jgi:ribose transport system substrate-binding protein
MLWQGHSEEEEPTVKRTSKVLAGIASLVLVSGCSSGATPSGSPSTGAPTAATPSESSGASPSAASIEAWTKSDIFKGFDPTSLDLTSYTPGPNGEHSTAAADVPDPTPECLQKVRDEKLKLAFLSSAQVTWFAAIEKGVREKAAEYGIDVVMTADSAFDPAKQASDVETAMASKPDILIALPNDPVSAAQAFKPAVDAGTTVVFYDNPADGWTAGKEYVTIVTGDHYRMGKDAADLLGGALGGQGTYGFIQLDTAFYNTNNREKGFVAEMAQKYPNIKNVAWSGFTAESTVGDATDAMLTQNPNLDGIYVSYSGGAGTAVLASLQAAGNSHVKVVTHDLDNANDVVLATKDSNYYGTAVEQTYDEGANTVKAAVLSRCGVDVPPFIVVPALAVNRDNLAQAWHDVLHVDPPAAVVTALGQ